MYMREHDHSNTITNENELTKIICNLSIENQKLLLAFLRGLLKNQNNGKEIMHNDTNK